MLPYLPIVLRNYVLPGGFAAVAWNRDGAAERPVHLSVDRMHLRPYTFQRPTLLCSTVRKFSFTNASVQPSLRAVADAYISRLYAGRLKCFCNEMRKDNGFQRSKILYTICVNEGIR